MAANVMTPSPLGMTGRFYVIPHTEEPDWKEEQVRAKIFFGRARLLGYVANVILKQNRQKVIIEDFLQCGDWSDDVKRGLQESGNEYRIDPLELFSKRRNSFSESIKDVLEKEYGDRECFSVTIQPVDGSEEFKLNVRPTAASRTSVFMDAGLAAWRITEKIGIGCVNASAIARVDFT